MLSVKLNVIIITEDTVVLTFHVDVLFNALVKYLNTARVNAVQWYAC